MHSYVEVPVGTMVDLVGKVEYAIRLYRTLEEDIGVREYVTRYNKILAIFTGRPDHYNTRRKLHKRGVYPSRSYEAEVIICADIRASIRTKMNNPTEHDMVFVAGQSVEMLDIALSEIRRFINQYNDASTMMVHDKVDTGGVL